LRVVKREIHSASWCCSLTQWYSYCQDCSYYQKDNAIIRQSMVFLQPFGLDWSAVSSASLHLYQQQFWFPVIRLAFQTCFFVRFCAAIRFFYPSTIILKNFTSPIRQRVNILPFGNPKDMELQLMNPWRILHNYYYDSCHFSWWDFENYQDVWKVFIVVCSSW